MTAWAERRPPRFLGGPKVLVDFLLSAHISALAIAMLLFYHDRLWIVAFAAATAIASKTAFRVPYGNGTRHFLNPSNFAISVTLLLFPSVGLAFPWQFSEGLTGIADWLLVAGIFALGSTINLRYTRRIPVVLGFLGGFVFQFAVRTLFLGASPLGTIMPVTGPEAWLYIFYMIPDPATTPERTRTQVVFGAAVAAVYLALVVMHVAFGLFFALTIVCVARGLGLYAGALVARLRSAPQPALAVGQ